MKKNFIICFSIFCAFIFSIAIIHKAQAQLTVTQGAGLGMTPLQLVQQVLIGSGITVSNATFNGSAANITSNMIGSYNAAGPAATQLGFTGGVIIASGNTADAIGPNLSGGAGTSMGTGSDPDLQLLIPSYTVHDKAVLEFDFIPLSDTVKFNYVFGSEEFDEYCYSSFNDVFGFFISGPGITGPFSNNAKNIALMPNNPSNYVTIDNVCSAGAAYSWLNNGGLYYQYDRLTKVYTAWSIVIPCLTYHIKLAVGDAGDEILDSGVFLEANSFSSNAIAVGTTFTTNLDTMAIEGCNDAIISFVLNTPATSPYIINYTISGTATNGVDYPAIPPTSVTIPTGQDSVAVVISPILDNIPEGNESVILTVQTSVCGNTKIFTVFIKDNTTLVAIASGDTTICVGQATLSAIGSGGFLGLGMNYTYQWSDSAASTTNSIVVSPTTNTTYYVTVTDTCGAIAVDSAIVSIGSGSADAGKDTTICPGTTATLIASGGITYYWSNNVNTDVNLVSPLQTTTYYVTASTGPCSGSDLVTVFVEKLLNADFVVHPQVVSVFEPEVSFHDITTGYSPPVSWFWDLGNGDTQNVPDFVYTYNDTGKFIVTLVVSDQYGCMDSTYDYVIVQPDYTIYFPNSFTPNGDGHNDVYEVFGTGIKAFNIKIFDRWGKMVYTSGDMNAGWNGKYEGRKVQQGVYTYSVYYKDARKKEHLVYGMIMLYR